MRRSGGNTSAARAVSAKDERAGRDPNRRAGASKPGPAAAAPTALPGGGADDDRDWTPAHALAPGLHVVATPIGNLGDITLRALWVLRGADRILCEDMRVTARLFARFGIDKPLLPYHDHNADRARPGILAMLRAGERLALVSDAGTPLVSDPGFKLVRAALAEGLPVTMAPGPSAAIAALVLSGLPPDRFLFVGFLPPRSAARRRALSAWRNLDATLVCYESPARLAASLADMADVLGDRPAAVARELTKRYEEVRRDGLTALAAHYRQEGAPRGEVVVVVGPPEESAPDDATIDRRLDELLSRLSLRDAAALLAEQTGIARNVLYRRALALQPGARK